MRFRGLHLEFWVYFVPRLFPCPLFMHLSDDARKELEAVLLRPDGPSTILIVGNRMSGKTTLCEQVLRSLGQHVVRWTPYEEFVVGRVSKAFSDLDTIVFVDDADVLVRLTKGSSVGLIEALQHSRTTPRIRIVLTALDTKGRVWRAVAACVDLIVTIPEIQHHVKTRKARPEKVSWGSVVRASGHAVASRVMRNWCEAREADEDLDAGVEASRVRGDLGPINHDRVSYAIDANIEGDADGCVVRKIAEILLG